MNVISYTACCVILLALAIWFRRARSRILGDLESELAQWKEIPTDQLGPLCIVDGEDDISDRAELIAKMVGRSGFIAMQRKTRGLVRIIQAGHNDCAGLLDDDDVRYIAEKAAALRMEMPWVTVELGLSSLWSVSKLHAFRAARLYCQIAGCISDAAIASGSSDLMGIAARL
jgi:hypothetical protein